MAKYFYYSEVTRLNKYDRTIQSYISAPLGSFLQEQVFLVSIPSNWVPSVISEELYDI